MKQGPDNVKALVALGASVTIDGVGPDIAKGLVALARGSGAHITIADAGKYGIDVLKEIAALGPKNVSFEGL